MQGPPVASVEMTKRQTKQTGPLPLQTDSGPSVPDTRRRSSRKPKQVSAKLSGLLAPQMTAAAVRKRQARKNPEKRATGKHARGQKKEAAGSSKRLGKSKQRPSATAAENGGRSSKGADSGAQKNKGTKQKSKSNKKTQSRGKEGDASAGKKASARRKALNRSADKQGGLKKPPRARDANGMPVCSPETSFFYPFRSPLSPSPRGSSEATLTTAIDSCVCMLLTTR